MINTEYSERKKTADAFFKTTEIEYPIFFEKEAYFYAPIIPRFDSHFVQKGIAIKYFMLKD